MTEQELSDEISAVIEARMLVPWQDAEPAAKALATMVKQYIERHIAAGQKGAGDVAPWPDFAGNPIRSGDRITHPDGTAGTVVFVPGFDSVGDAWRVVYGGSSQLRRLCLQIGDKGMATVRRHATPQPPKPAGNAIDGLLETARPFLAEELLTSQGYAWRGGKWVAPERPKPAGAVPLPDLYETIFAAVNAASPRLGDSHDNPDAHQLGIRVREHIAGIVFREVSAREAAAQSIPRELYDWLGARDLLPDPEEDGSIEVSEIIDALDRHEDALIEAAAPPAPQQMTTQGEGGGLSASTVEAISAAMIRMGVAVPEGKERQRAHAESMVIELCHAITSRTAEGAGREAVVTTLVCDPEDESGDGPWFSLQDWARLRELPPGTKLYTNHSPVADAEAVKANAARYLWLRDVSVPVKFTDMRYTPAEVDKAIDEAIAARRLTGSQP